MIREEYAEQAIGHAEMAKLIAGQGNLLHASVHAQLATAYATLATSAPELVASKDEALKQVFKNALEIQNRFNADGVVS